MDGDGTADQIEFEILKEGGYDCGYRLKVNDEEITNIGCIMDSNLYVLKLGLNEYYDESYCTLLMISDNGPSADYRTHVYLYEMDESTDGHKLLYAGIIPSLTYTMQADDDIITTWVRTNFLCTWYRKADFALARSALYGEKPHMKIYEIPRYLYPIGIVATLRIDLPLLKDMGSDEYSCCLSKGEEVILCAGDDKEWVLIESAQGAKRGWLKMKDDLTCIVGEQLLSSEEVFSGLPFFD